MSGSIKKPKTPTRAELNVKLNVLPQYILVLQGYCYGLQKAVHKNNTKEIVADMDELLITCERSSNLIQEVIKRVVQDASERANLEEVAVDIFGKIPNALDGGSLRSLLLTSLGCAYKLVLIDYLGVSSRFPQEAEQLVDLFNALHHSNLDDAERVTNNYEIAAKKWTQKPESYVEETNADDVNFNLDVLLALQSLGLAFVSVIRCVQLGNGGRTGMLNAIQLATRALNGLILKHITKPQTQLELLDEVRALFGDKNE